MKLGFKKDIKQSKIDLSEIFTSSEIFKLHLIFKPQKLHFLNHYSWAESHEHHLLPREGIFIFLKGDFNVIPWETLVKYLRMIRLSLIWPPDVKCRLTGKYPDAGKDWRQGETGGTEDEMIGQHHRLSEHEFE